MAPKSVVQGVIRRGFKRVAAHQQAVKRKHLLINAGSVMTVDLASKVNPLSWYTHARSPGLSRASKMVMSIPADYRRMASANAPNPEPMTTAVLRSAPNAAPF